MKNLFVFILASLTISVSAHAITISQQWDKVYGGSGIERSKSLQQTFDGGYILAGITDSFGIGSYDILVFKLNSNGDIIWQKTYGTSSSFHDYLYKT